MSIAEQVAENDFQEKFDPNHPLVKKHYFPLPKDSYRRKRSETCFQQGTQIQLADGSEKAIEEIEPTTLEEPESGDSLLSIDGERIRIMSVVAGPEVLPLIRIAAISKSRDFPEKKFEVTVTAFHSMLMNNSLLRIAGLIREGDRIRTVLGEAIVVDTEWVPSKEYVWNLILGSELFLQSAIKEEISVDRLYHFHSNSLLGLTPKQHLLVANGVVTGDWNLQIQLSDLTRRGISLTDFT